MPSKHALTKTGKERDDLKLLRRFNDLQNDHMLFVGWHDYMLAVNAMPIEAHVFQAWYFALYPEKLNPKIDASRYDAFFPKLRNRSRKDQKVALREKIRASRLDSTVLRDPVTERRPLVLPK
jgi:ribosomal protein S30